MVAIIIGEIEVVGLFVGDNLLTLFAWGRGGAHCA